MDVIPKLGENEVKVLRVVRQRAMDGYSLLSSTGLNAKSLVESLSKLQDLVSVKGELSSDRIGEAYVVLPPTNKGLVDMILAR